VRVLQHEQDAFQSLDRSGRLDDEVTTVPCALVTTGCCCAANKVLDGRCWNSTLIPYVFHAACTRDKYAALSAMVDRFRGVCDALA